MIFWVHSAPPPYYIIPPPIPPRTARHAHIIPLRRFLEGVMEMDLREFFAETCFEVRVFQYYCISSSK